MSKLIRITCITIMFSLLLMILPVSAINVNKPVYKSKCCEEKKIALTFDDGPHPKKTEEILNILKKYDVKATFFVIGVNVKNYPKTMEKIINEGHEIGNHTYSHRKLKGIGKEEIKKEINKTEEILTKIGNKSYLIRPPCGEYDENLVDLAIENDYKIVLWNIDTKDWAHTSKEEIVEKVISNSSGGDIILFHDYLTGKNNTVEALEIIIPKLINSGYEFVTAGELLQE